MPRRWLNAKAHQKQSHFTSGRRSGVKNVCAKYFVSYKPTIIVETILHDQVFQEVSLITVPFLLCLCSLKKLVKVC